jgi:hypothetical protein
VGASNREADPLGAGLYVFCNRRWISLESTHEKASLIMGLQQLSATFPSFRPIVDIDSFLTIFSRIVGLWSGRKSHKYFSISNTDAMAKEESNSDGDSFDSSFCDFHHIPDELDRANESTESKEQFLSEQQIQQLNFMIL